MKLLVIQGVNEKNETILKQTKEKLKAFFETVEFEVWSRTKMNFTKADIEKTEADLLLTFNLAGFELGTLMGGLTYNLLNCKQIHILLHDNPAKESSLSKPLSIAMFFYCAGDVCYKRLQEAYPDIPYLKELEGWNRENTSAAINENAEILCNAVREVAGICHIKQAGSAG